MLYIKMKRKAGQKDDIYIDCQPVNDEGSALVDFDVVQRGLEAVEKSGDKLDVSGFLSNPLVGVLIGVIGLYALIKVAQLGIGAISNKKK
jgi:hypothetical protein